MEYETYRSTMGLREWKTPVTKQWRAEGRRAETARILEKKNKSKESLIRRAYKEGKNPHIVVDLLYSCLEANWSRVGLPVLALYNTRGWCVKWVKETDNGDNQ